MNVRGVAGKQNAPSAIAGRLIGAVRPCGGKLERRQSDVGDGDAPQHRLHMVERDRLGPVESASVEVGHRDRPGG